MITPDNILTEARRWIGTPYRHQARGPIGPEGGVDCVGLLIVVSQALGLIGNDYDPTGYDWETDGSQLQAELSKWAECIASSSGGFSTLDWEESGQLRPGDIVVMRIVGLPQHTGIISEIDYSGLKVSGLIHAYNVEKKVVEHRLDDRWAKRIIQVWRLKEGL